jgi:excinuclease UvrABC nuclease subunit
MYEDSARIRDQLKAINSFKIGQRKLEADFSNRDVIGFQNKDKHFRCCNFANSRREDIKQRKDFFRLG